MHCKKWWRCKKVKKKKSTVLFQVIGELVMIVCSKNMVFYIDIHVNEDKERENIFNI